MGSLESKVRELIDFFEDKDNKAIMFLDEIHMLFSGDTYSRVAQMLKPAMSRGSIRVIGATTTQEVRKLDSDAVDVKEDRAYAVLCGNVNIKKTERSFSVMRLLRIKDGKAETVKEYRGKIPSRINSVIVCNNSLYIGCDKMVLIFDLENDDVFGGVIYKTCISREDEEDLIKTQING